MTREEMKQKIKDKALQMSVNGSQRLLADIIKANLIAYLNDVPKMVETRKKNILKANRKKGIKRLTKDQKENLADYQVRLEYDQMRARQFFKNDPLFKLSNLSFEYLLKNAKQIIAEKGSLLNDETHRERL